MGFLANSLSLVRYQVEGDLPDGFWDFAGQRLTQFAFRDIDDAYDERSVGWVSIHNMFDAGFAGTSFAVADYLVASLRIDERRVAPAVLKKFCQKEEEKKKAQEKRPRLSRAERVEIKERMQLVLLKRAAPVPAVFDLVWSLGDQTVYFGSSNQKIRGIFESLFAETFGLSLLLQIPFLVAGQMLPPEEAAALDALSPCLFV
ncbi:MAG: recombination-associated protein RdgC [Thermodesulfobacteriota bacterium]